MRAERRCSPSRDIQVDVDRHVIGWLVPAADMAVDARIDQAVGGLRRQQQMIDADAVILCPCAGLVIPKAVEVWIIAHSAYRIGQSEVDERTEFLPCLR